MLCARPLPGSRRRRLSTRSSTSRSGSPSGGCCLPGSWSGPCRACRPGRLAWVSLGLLAAFAAWTALSLGWTESSEQHRHRARPRARLPRRLRPGPRQPRQRESQRVIGAVATAIVVVSLVGLLSRLHPGWFSTASDTPGILTERERLSYPINYWNGLAGLIAIGVPLLLQIATCARSVLVAGAGRRGDPGDGADDLPHPLARRHRCRGHLRGGLRRAHLRPPAEAARPAGNRRREARS